MSHAVWMALRIAVSVVASEPSRLLKVTSAAVRVISSPFELISGTVWAAVHAWQRLHVNVDVLRIHPDDNRMDNTDAVHYN